MQNYTYPLFVIEVPHQRTARGYTACGYWTDQVPSADDLSGCYACATVDDLVQLTHATDVCGCQARHQAARIAALANQALNDLCEYLAEGLADGANND